MWILTVPNTVEELRIQQEIKDAYRNVSHKAYDTSRYERLWVTEKERVLLAERCETVLEEGQWGKPSRRVGLARGDVWKGHFRKKEHN